MVDYAKLYGLKEIDTSELSEMRPRRYRSNKWCELLRTFLQKDITYAEIISGEIINIHYAKSRWMISPEFYGKVWACRINERVFLINLERETKEHPDLSRIDWNSVEKMKAQFKKQFAKQKKKATCERCGNVMDDGKGCTGRTYLFDNAEELSTLKYGDDWIEVPAIAENCRYCNCAKEQFHHKGCDIERCPKCKGQLLRCGCKWKE